MAKVFRPFDIQGNNNIVDWEKSNAYGTQAISEIVDPDGATAAKEITSIPSPFARIDLVKTAFKEVSDMVRKTPGLDRLPAEQVKKLIEFGNERKPTIYHKLVSEALDVAEIFFNIDRFKDKFEIIVWDRKNDINTNRVFGSTLNKYLKADSQGDDPYNFGKMQRIYMLNYIGHDRPSTLNIVGATSPATLFFSSANDLTYVSRHVAFNTDRPFDDEYNPLFRRDFEFQKYLFAFRKSYSGFARDFPEVSTYLDLTYRCLDNSKKQQIDNLNQNSIDTYEQLVIGDNNQDTLDVLGRPFHKKPTVINWHSDFEIKSTIYNGQQKPLVLPIVKGSTYSNLTYTIGPWGDSVAPCYCADTWKSRRLPVVNDEYPYLTISDFLAPFIIRTPDEINSSSYFDGGYVCKNAQEPDSYLLPLTDLFFQFFTVEDLQKEWPNGKKMFEFADNVGGVKVILRIPIQKGYIEYSRVYYEGQNANVLENDGALVEAKFGLGIMPMIRFPENVQKHYRIAFFDKSKENVSLEFRNAFEMIESSKAVRRRKDSNACSHESYIVNDNFDRIKVVFGDAEGFIVPKFKNIEGNAQYTFAVDFGTTNTHIEYCTDSKKSPVAFNILANERQLHKFHKVNIAADIRKAFEQDFIPDTVADKTDNYSFPMRTAFAQRTDIDYNTNPMPLADGNIPFLYERDATPNYNVVKTELKWGGVPERLLEMNLETIFILLRNKVVLNGGDLSATKIIWFYPASMTQAKVNQFKKIWKESYEKYFGDNSTQNVISISESKAPYLHFIKSQGAAYEIVTIDIGGGTTDVFVVEGQQDKMLLSFRFASNAIFGDAYNSNPSRNGFVCKYKDEFKQKLDSNGLEELSNALCQIEEQQKSSDIVAFLFSLVGERVKDNKELSFLRKLENDDKLRYVFIIFYGSLLYFIAKAMKLKGLQKPKTIAFSGNGAKTLNILSDDLETVARFAKLIFDGVYDDKTGFIEVMMEKNPKIATCKGGIEVPKAQPYDSINDIKTIFTGNGFEDENEPRLTYGQITPEIKKQVVQAVKDYLQFLFDLHKNNGDFLFNNLGGDPDTFGRVREICLGDEGEQLLSDSLIKGLQNKKDVDKVSDETDLEETLFFYPLVGLLHKLAFEISKI